MPETCRRCGADLEQPYAVEYTDTEYVRYRARVVATEAGSTVSEEMDGSDYLGTQDRGEPECAACGEPVGLPRTGR